MQGTGHWQTFSVSTTDKDAKMSLHNKTIEAINCSTHHDVMIDVNPYLVYWFYECCPHEIYHYIFQGYIVF